MTAIGSDKYLNVAMGDVPGRVAIRPGISGGIM